ncbi:MAG: hypothetical protein WC802_01585 [Patescibacteria group bacterium]|jgi:hypothetical protein
MQDKIEAEKAKLKETALQWIEHKVAGISTCVLLPALVLLNVLESGSDILNVVALPSVLVPIIPVFTFIDAFVAWGYNEAVTGTLIAAITFELVRRAKAWFDKSRVNGSASHSGE